MDVVSVAVTGAAGLVGRRLVAALAAEPSVDRVVALDVRAPDPLPRRVESHRVDIAGTELVPFLGGVDVVVHLAGVVDPVPDEALMARVNVDGTRRVLDAAAAVGARRVVRVSSATVYGAWPDNPVPLTEDAQLRPNAHFSPAVQGAEVERLLGAWRRDHPGVVVTTLRSAPVVGPGTERLPVRVRLGQPLLRVRGAAPPLQVVHVDDLVAALVLAVTSDLPGVYNVAADGWLDAAAADALLPRPTVPALPERTLTRLLRRTWDLGVGDVPPGIVPYLVHPWVIATDKLRAAGWAPTRSNEDAIREALAAGPPARSWPVRNAAIATGGVIVTGVVVSRWRKRRRTV
jgi:nucleoside-diphosphate-sugar epimerase